MSEMQKPKTAERPLLIRRCCVVALLAVAMVPAPAAGRIVSYAPVTDELAFPVIQNRSNRHFVLAESVSGEYSPAGGLLGRLVLYDSRGREEPRTVFPPGPGLAGILNAAVWEGEDEIPRILVNTDADLDGDNPHHWPPRLLYSPDAGLSWMILPIPADQYVFTQFELFDSCSDTSSLMEPVDSGGPFARGPMSGIQVGSREFPFVVMGRSWGSYSVSRSGAIRLLVQPGPSDLTAFIGSNASGTTFLLQTGGPGPWSVAKKSVFLLDLEGRLTKVGDLPGFDYALDGWITPRGDIYLNLVKGALDRHSVALFTGGSLEELATAPVVRWSPIPSAFGVPTADFSGAWIVRRGPGEPTILSRHVPGGPPVEQWHDDAGPEVEAIHTGASGQRLLVQVNRSRPLPDQQAIRDPALAIWEVGGPAPRRYDELFLRETRLRRFVSLDVDAAVTGAPFVFDSGTLRGGGGCPSGGGGGGGADVIQEWGVVRASLRQRLAVPAVARSAGKNGSFWKTDLILRNPSPDPVSVSCSFVPNDVAGTGPGQGAVLAPVDLGPGEIRVVPDLLATLFGIDSGFGTFFLTPAGSASIEATSRTFTTTPSGSVGMGVGAVDLETAIGPGFPVTFAAALQGTGYRTNVSAADTSGRGAGVQLELAAEPGGSQAASFHIATPAGGPFQANDLSSWLGAPASRAGAVTARVTSGSAIPFLVVVDDRTNDPTYFPPDIPTSLVRTIPAIVHASGENGALYRSDLFLFNPTDVPRPITLAAKRWDDPGNEMDVTVTLGPGESRRFTDALSTVFGMTGVARLRVQTQHTMDPDSRRGIAVTSRTYSVDPSGGTRGLLIPPLNAFQAAGPGDTLSILGTAGNPGTRTNLALVELSAPVRTPATVSVRIEIQDERAAVLDVISVTVPVAGGIQLGDLFRSRGLGDGPAAALIRISPLEGMIGAYATGIDRGTNDSTYFAANLEAK